MNIWHSVHHRVEAGPKWQIVTFLNPSLSVQYFEKSHKHAECKTWNFLSRFANVELMSCNAKCKLIPPNGGITKESWNWIAFLSVAQCQMQLASGYAMHWKLDTEDCTTINHLHAPGTALMFGCSGTWSQGWKLRSASHETTMEPHDLVYYLGLETALHGRKKVFLARPPSSPIMREDGVTIESIFLTERPPLSLIK